MVNDTECSVQATHIKYVQVGPYWYRTVPTKTFGADQFALIAYSVRQIRTSQ